MTNEDLALSLLNIFRPFGNVTSVKASRDPKGRPFGFIEFAEPAAALSALAYAACLTLDSRRIRVEPARRQRKLCIKQRLSGPVTVERALEGMRTALGRWVSEGDFKLSVQSGEETERWLGEHREAEQVVAAIVKFESAERAQQAYVQWKKEHPEWSLFWINLDRTSIGSNVRNSGLVQLVPAPDGTILPTGVDRFNSGYTFLSYPLSRHASVSPPPSLGLSNGLGNGVGYALYSPPSPSPPALPMLPPRFAPHYEEASYDAAAAAATAPEHSLTRDLSQLQIRTDPEPESSSEDLAVQEWLGNTLFVGRLNGQSVSLTLLHAHFSPHGQIVHIRLYNRGAVGLDGVPLDAYAFIRFDTESAVLEAIEAEHGRAWLGQAIKCEPARKGPLAAMLRRSSDDEQALRSVSPPMSPVGGFAVYYPMGMGPILASNSPTSPPPPAPLSKSPPSPASNWFRATKAPIYTRE